MRNPLKTVAIAGAAVTLAAAAAAQDRPPQDALPLSEVLAAVEGAHDLAWIEEVEWEDDGHWEITFHGADGSKTEIDVDPLTGAVIQR